MSDEDLMKLMLKVDPQTARIPPGVRAIANAVEAAERERCASLARGAIHEATRAGSADALLIISDLHRRITAWPNVEVTGNARR